MSTLQAYLWAIVLQLLSSTFQLHPVSERELYAKLGV